MAAIRLICCSLLWLGTVLHCTLALNYVVTTPNTLRFGVRETIGISVSGAARHVNVQVYLQDYPGRKTVFSSQQLTVANGKPKLTTVTVQPENIPELQRNASQVLVYVVVKATQGEFPVKEVLVPITKYSGYAFIQTDKPLYLPNQEVQIRILYLDEQMLPNKKPFTLEVQNPKRVRVMYKDMLPDAKGITETHFKFSASPMFGNWTITVYYGYQLSATSTVKFEVKEYVLPTFSVHIEPPKTILSNSAEVKGRVTARYVYGKPVQGTVHLKYEIRTKEGGVIPIGVSKFNKLGREGQFGFRINVERDIKNKGIPWFPAISGSLFVVEAEVVEQATGNRETAVDSSSVFTTSPYIITFSRSLKDFKPSVPYQVQVDVHYASGDPLDHRIQVKVATAIATKAGASVRQLNKQPSLETDQRGRIMFQFDTDGKDEQLQITVKTADEGVPEENQATSKLTVVRYMSPVANHYVWIAAPQDEITFKVGKTFQTSVTVYPAERNNLYYMVVSRGSIVLFEEVASDGGALVRTIQFLVTASMSPSARLIVFIMKQGKIIADSMRLEVEKTCNYNKGKGLQLRAHTASGMFTPGQRVDLEIHGEPESHVGLVAVDEALYVLNKRHLLRPDTMFSEMESHDLGCGPGGGENTEAVFRNAGIMILSDAAVGDHSRKASNCKGKTRAKREAMEKIVHQYTGNASYCCQLGLLQGADKKDCTERSKEIQNEIGESYNCSQAFLDCCQHRIKYEAALLARANAPGRNEISSPEELIEMFEENTLASIRRFFPETWFFNTIKLGGPKCRGGDKAAGTCLLPFTSPHSITTWQVQAVGISETTGMCVAEPLKVSVFKPMFIQLDLPYSAVRSEQIEVPATIFNYGDDDLKVSVYMFGVEGICMGASDGERSEIRKITVPSNGAKTVTFPVMPLQVTEYNLRVMALSSGGSDAVEKTLRVVPEGVQKEISLPLVLDPIGFYRRKRRNQPVEGITEIYDNQLHKQTITVDVDLPDNHIPGTGKCVVSVVGAVMGQAIVTTLSGVEQRFITLPTGCGEQTMVRLGPLVYTMLYLKRSNQMTASAEKNGYDFMQRGYMNQLRYRQRDGSFAVWATGYASSTWLTAFVARVFCQAQVFVKASKDASCGAVDWMLTRQRPTGAFHDAYGLRYYPGMTGGVQDEVTLTAFVLITMQECQQCDSAAKRTAVGRAVNFLEKQVESLQKPHAVAITAYALTLARSQKAAVAVQRLKNIAVFDESTYTLRWNEAASQRGGGAQPWVYQPRASAVAVETTSYALLTMLANDDVEYSHPIANWLNQQRSAGGSFVSTQDTVVALQALAEYSGKAVIPSLDMVCNVTSQASSRGKRSIVLKKHNALTLQEEEIPVGGKLVVTAQGKGLASMSVALQYNVEKRPEEICKYELTIKSSEYKDAIKPAQKPPVFKNMAFLPEPVIRNITSKNELYKFGYEDENNEDDDRYQAAAAGQGPSYQVVELQICSRYLSNKPAKMSILEIGLFTGYKAFRDDLRNLTANKDLTKVSYYELSDRSVILYLEEVPINQPLCLKLRATQEIAVGKVQSTAVKIYNYYEPGESCTKFYRPDGNSPMLQQICEAGQCICVEGQCPKCDPFEAIKNLNSRQRSEKLVEMACEHHNFVWSVIFVKTFMEGSFRYYEVEVEEVLKQGLQDKNELEEIGTVRFASREVCSCPDMTAGDKYVIMGNDGFQYKTKEGETLFKYVFDKGTTVYHFTAIRDKPQEYQQLQKSFNTLVKLLVNTGCPT